MKIKLFYDFQEKSTKVELLEEIFVGKMYVPKGFVSDGGSIPRFFWRILNPLDGRYLRIIYSVTISFTKQDFVLEKMPTFSFVKIWNVMV